MNKIFAAMVSLSFIFAFYNQLNFIPPDIDAVTGVVPEVMAPMQALTNAWPFS